MAQTVNSSGAAYATGSDLVDHRDWRAVADQLKDDNTRPASSAAVSGDALVAKALKWGSGQVELAATTGARYLPEDLTALAGGGTVGGAALVGLVCDLAFWWLKKRRNPGLHPDQVSGVPEALDLLERLRLGERVFPFTETQQAGLAETVSLDPLNPVAAQRDSLTVTARRFFGLRG